MPGRVLAVAIVSLLLAAPSFPQCNLAPVAGAQFRSTIFDLSIDGNRGWAATGYGITLYDLSADPPLILDSIGLPGTTRVVRAANGVAYVASGSAIQVVRWNGRTLQLAGSVDAGATINDLALTTIYLYAATANRIMQFDLLNPNAPAKTSATFSTSAANIGSLALTGDILYATDGDPSVEVFSIITPALPQRLGSFNTLIVRPTAIHARDSRVYVSDGQQTDIFAGTAASPSRAGAETFPFGSTSFAALTSSAIFVAGNDRRLRAFDVSSAAAPVEIFRTELAATSGTVNRINAIELGLGHLYAGAGDIGLLAYDVRLFTAPFPMRSYATIATGSVVAAAGRAYFGRAAGLVEYAQTSSGALTEGRSWDKSRPGVTHDVDNDFLLTSSGATATMWALSPTTPTPIGTTTFSSPVKQAVQLGTTAYAVLEDRTLWSADLTQLSAAPRQIAINIAPQFIVRSGSNIALADLRNDGTTVVAMLKADGSGIAGSASVAGIATAGVALSGTTAAVWTFRGLTLISFPAGSTTVLPQSNTVAATRLAMNGAKLVEMTDSAVIVWDIATQRVTAQYTVPGTPAAVAISPNGSFADLATFDGVTAVQLAPASRMPSLVPAANPNLYAKKLVATANRLVLFDGRNADLFNSSLGYRGGIHVSGTVDVAANDSAVFTMSNTLGVGKYTIDGDPLGAAIVTEGTDAQPLTLNAMNGAVWASIVRGCPLNCEKKTIVFDARGALTQTATMTGAVRDVALSGARAYVLTELPDEIRVLDISDPAHPRQLASRASEGTRLPLSIAYANGVVYVLGEKLVQYAEGDLSKLAEPLGAYVDDPALGVTYADQRVRIDGGCLAITGRQYSPQLFTTALAPQASFATPSAARAIAAQPGRLYVLTDHSLEIWSASPLPVPLKRRAAH
ncbi:MAG: hypothetical protein AABO58_12095 [Acidobacteriota bacterium]